MAHRSAVLEASVVRGPAIIGPGARIMHSYVGPYTSIGRDVLIEGAELEHSIVFPGARIQHLSSGSRRAWWAPARGSSGSSACREPCA